MADQPADPQVHADPVSSSMDTSTVVVTGAGRGIGRAIALEMAASSDRPLWLISRSRNPLEETAERCRQIRNRPVETSLCDLSNPEEVRSLQRPGNLPAVGMMVHNAGSFLFEPAEKTTDDVLRSQWNLHAAAPIELTRKFLPEMRMLNRGLLVYIGSEVVQKDKKGHAAYASSKHALRGWVGSLREELTDSRIAVTMIHPGQVWTHSWESVDVDLDELADAADVARMVSVLPTLSPRTVVSELYLGPQRGERSPF